jgi:hypothetical protein
MQQSNLTCAPRAADSAAAEQEAAIGGAILAMLRTVAGRDQAGALAVDRLVDRRAR